MVDSWISAGRSFTPTEMMLPCNLLKLIYSPILVFINNIINGLSGVIQVRP